MIKKVGSCYYVHKSNRQELFNKVKDEKLKIKVLGMDGLYSYQIIKYDKKNRTVSLIQSPDWYESNEPLVGDGLIFNLDSDDMECKIIKMKKNPQIYHHRWMFMNDNDRSIDIKKSKERSEMLFSIPSFNSKEVKSRIGYKNYWITWCRENNVEL